MIFFSNDDSIMCNSLLSLQDIIGGYEMNLLLKNHHSFSLKLHLGTFFILLTPKGVQLVGGRHLFEVFFY